MDSVYTPAEVAERYHTTELTLAQWRYKKKGPAFFRSGKRVLYREAALVAYEKAQEAPQAAEREPA
jgi:hypothetical protein